MKRQLPTALSSGLYSRCARLVKLLLSIREGGSNQLLAFQRLLANHDHVLNDWESSPHIHCHCEEGTTPGVQAVDGPKEADNLWTPLFVKGSPIRQRKTLLPSSLSQLIEYNLSGKLYLEELQKDRFNSRGTIHPPVSDYFRSNGDTLRRQHDASNNEYTTNTNHRNAHFRRADTNHYHQELPWFRVLRS